jgi:hypothetical protein
MESRIEEGHLMSDHAHVMISIVSATYGSATMRTSRFAPNPFSVAGSRIGSG